MDQIKEKHAKIVEEMEKDSKEKDSEIVRLQTENCELKSLPGISLLIILSYLLAPVYRLTGTISLSCINLIKRIFEPIIGFYLFIFNTSADWSETVCYFIEYNAIKLRWKLTEIREEKKERQSPKPKVAPQTKENSKVQKRKRAKRYGKS
eukprot:TRINITY_DN40318_c0_g2_i1.p1 TRINITY_DN40318_c0_g2~~TRINITY_DN40318_c0_g2_i1.p1  ORF type:complete len:150 (-),score=26.42 TRINITY_DN40318_c0_g2_i1:41-490(-)